MDFGRRLRYFSKEFGLICIEDCSMLSTTGSLPYCLLNRKPFEKSSVPCSLLAEKDLFRVWDKFKLDSNLSEGVSGGI